MKPHSCNYYLEERADPGCNPQLKYHIRREGLHNDPGQLFYIPLEYSLWPLSLQTTPPPSTPSITPLLKTTQLLAHPTVQLHTKLLCTHHTFKSMTGEIIYLMSVFQTNEVWRQDSSARLMVHTQFIDWFNIWLSWWIKHCPHLLLN